jgi:hypothetical protein
LGPKPGIGSQVLIHYYAEFAPLSDDTSSNTCLKVAWDAVLYGALSAACDYLVDDRSPARSKAATTRSRSPYRTKPTPTSCLLMPWWPPL